MNMPALAVACDTTCKSPPLSAAPCTGPLPAAIEGERKHEKQIADLRHRRIGDEQLQALLPECDDATDDNGRGTQCPEQLRRG